MSVLPEQEVEASDNGRVKETDIESGKEDKDNHTCSGTCEEKVFLPPILIIKILSAKIFESNHVNFVT